jgi:hypothetical protein
MNDGDNIMKTITVSLIIMALPGLALAQDDPSGKTLAATMEVFVFPTEGQDSSQQSKDEVECYQFATSSTGTDPFELSDQADMNEQLAAAEMEAAEATPKGAAGSGKIVRGAAAGAVIGEVTGGDAGESAAIGAAAVAVRGRRQARGARAEAEVQAEQQAAARTEATAADLENFKKAFSVCLEAKDYMVKY